jgi:hypothetical protein
VNLNVFQIRSEVLGLGIFYGLNMKWSVVGGVILGGAGKFSRRWGLVGGSRPFWACLGRIDLVFNLSFSLLPVSHEVKTFSVIYFHHHDVLPNHKWTELSETMTPSKFFCQIFGHSDEKN